MKFVQAKHFHAGGNTPMTRVVIHDMEMPEKADTAEACAAYFAKGTKTASAHYCVDSDSVVQCVKEGDIAYHAPPNTGSIGIEHAGYARQSSGEWLDAFGTAMLRDVSAPLVRDICDRYGIPKVWLTVDDLLAGKHGVTSHNNVSLAWHKSTHTDPGPNFPVDQFMAWVNDQSPPENGDDMTPEEHDWLHQTTARVDRIRATLGIKDADPAVSPVLDQINAKLDNLATGNIDYDKLAKAVNDDAAKRRQNWA